ncbi:DUF2254 domain-containing protein [Azospirillum sp. SYSU D00513]|uniref:DUF2254 domain-containing protein n=1 Tax=Azospirillum sp. SYSU D00513 TaxID=2812561 RepID=UPI001A95C71E|nr:DUF2254 domain-containing protein [Azospirillum sp. SYSU D00513]
MLNRLITVWDSVRTSLWFLPALMTFVGGALGFAMLGVDAGHGEEDAVRSWWMNKGDGEDVRNLLSTLLTSVIAMASIVFSVTVVALTLAANQYGSRLVRAFRADLRNQATLGTFVMTIVYCLIVLRDVRGAADIHEVPHAAVTVGTGLSLLCVLALLAFIQGVSRSIVADELVKRVGHDLDEAVEELPELKDAPAPEHQDPGPSRDVHAEAAQLALPWDGYVQAIDYDGLVGWAERQGAVIRMDFRPGDFVALGDRRIAIHPPQAAEAVAKDGRLSGEVAGFVVVGEERTPTQDIEFAIRQLVEVAVRALSPGINDPFTATAAIDRLRTALSRAMGRCLPSELLRGRDGTVRVITEASTYTGIIDSAFNQIRQAGSGMPAVVIHMLEAIARIAEHTRLDEQREALARHARMIAAAGLRASEEPFDRADIERSLARALQATGAGSGRGGPGPTLLKAARG